MTQAIIANRPILIRTIIRQAFNVSLVDGLGALSRRFSIRYLVRLVGQGKRSGIDAKNNLRDFFARVCRCRWTG